ncbi:DNA recombination protein RmuC [Nitrincola lacisaponensis]|uniref:DNA recombination protein RmuC n=1 Tax=Nitrincola lacisaponensis TaxID=267850 RepID=A0A063Y4Z2_9GAMM|nr:DNA recombination protein RmuC [Nitrincola lacisaponensis]KDE40744.1 DNA recombination protein RmuC [Nitrincola lacisaponensis]
MQSPEWTTELIIIACVAGLVLAALGYLLAMVLLGRKNTELSSQLQQALASANAQSQQQLDEIKQLSATVHAKELAESKLQTQLDNVEAVGQSTEQRLNHTLAEQKAELEATKRTLDELRQQHRTTENELKTTQAEKRSFEEKTESLNERLENTEQSLLRERASVSDLKDKLAHEGKKSESLESKLEEVRNQLQETKTSLEAEKQRLEALQNTHQALVKTHTQLKTELDEREASHARELANFEKQKNSLAEHFKVLSNEILEAKSKSLQESSKLTLSSVMSPFQQSIDSFKKEVQEIHHRETSQQGELRKELESLKELNQKITTEAHELSTALRGQKKLQGNWGELVLENVLDRSGLQLGKDYKREVSFTTEEGRQRPDAVVYLPQGKHLIIDAKVSLNAYTRFVNAEAELERSQALKEHVQAVGSRIKELADRDYYKLPGLNSPEMVFMFIPIESAFVEALKADETLFQQAIENNVLVATPTTLLTSLNIVRQLWRYEDQNKHTAALASRAEGVFKKLNGFLASFEKIKKGLDSATNAYSTAEGQLISGKGNLVKQVSDFKKLAPAIKAELPSYFTDKADLEIDFIAAETPDITEQDITLITDNNLTETENTAC